MPQTVPSQSRELKYNRTQGYKSNKLSKKRLTLIVRFKTYTVKSHEKSYY